jgi:hypothetical protein
MWQTFGNTLSDMFVMSEDPNFLESNDIVVGICELQCNGLDAFCQVLRYIFETPKKMALVIVQSDVGEERYQQLRVRTRMWDTSGMSVTCNLS